MARASEKQFDVADVYAEALFGLAQEHGRVEQVRSELEELVSLLRSTPEAAAYFDSPAIDADQRGKLLEKWFRGRLCDELLNALLVINRNGRTGLLEPLLRCYVLRQEAAAGQNEALAVSAVPLEEDERRAVVETVRALSGKEPLVEYRVEPEIIGGLVLRIGDMLYDNSVRSQLHELHRRLHERGAAGVGIQTAV
ncbi:MAG TPA: ATP synthase F1 subunit delta [Phycisphaerae bacterium]|nr:ATP synthase F1 subunit delta [Phycisphaerae bacterium]